MGNSSSSGRGAHDDSVDFGALTPQGVYTGTRDWNQQVVGQLIVERRLAPFYRPLEDYEDDWDDAQILAARRAPPPPDEEDGAGETHGPLPPPARVHHKRGSTSGKERESTRLNEAALYRGAVECPICFLYYPPNINYSRCCDQAICTECFVQIKRAEPDPQHLESEPAACPYCVRGDFGVVYKPPVWRAGIGSEGGAPPSPGGQMQPQRPVARKRRQSVGANDPSVVTTDHIRPDWELKVAAVKAAVARRANRRIIMRQVGDRLIPVGISSGRVQVLPEGSDTPPDAQGEGSSTGSRRQRRRERELSRLLGLAGISTTDYPNGVIGTQDLEELMMAEAMRLSLLEEEQRQAKEQAEKEKAAKAGKQPASEDAASPVAGASSSRATGTSAPSSAGPASADASQSALHLPAVTGPSLLPPAADERGRAGHRPSSSVSALSPTDSSAAPGGSVRARSQPPVSALNILPAGGAAAAVGSSLSHPSPVLGHGIPAVMDAPPSHLPTPTEAPAAAAVATTSTKQSTSSVAPWAPSPAPAHVALPTSSVERQPIPTAAPTAVLNTPALATATAPRPVPAHAESFASSIASTDEPTAYDMLSSSPESDDGLSRRPLLRTDTAIVAPTPAVELDALDL